MARQLNSAHPLASSVISFVGVDTDGVTVKDFADATRLCTLSTDASVSIGSGTYGYHIQTGNVAENAVGVMLEPTVPWGVTGGNTLIMVLNNVDPVRRNAAGHMLATGGSSNTRPWIGVNDTGNVLVGQGTGVVATLTSVSTGHLDTGAVMVSVTRTSETSCQLFINGTLDVEKTGRLGYNNATAGYSHIGGFYSGMYGYRHCEVVWVIAFNKVLTPTEIADVYTSLGANNQIGLLETASPATTPVAFNGPVADQVGYTNTAFSLDIGSYFTGNATPFAYSLQAGTLPAGLTLTSSGVLSGTPTATGGTLDLVVRATDSASNVADTNPFDITINEYNPNNPPTFPGPNIANITVTQNGAMTSVSVTASFSDSDALTYSPVGTWPSGITVSTSGSISGTTGAIAGTYANLRVRATDTASQSVDSNLFSIIVEEAAVGQDGSIVTAPLKNNTGTVLSQQTCVVHVYTVLDGNKVATLTGQTTDVAGVLTVSDISIVAGTEYRVVVVMADGGEGLARYIAS